MVKWQRGITWFPLLLRRKAMTNLDSALKSWDIIFQTKVCIVKTMAGFFCSHVAMWELDHKEGWVPNNWCFQTVVLEKTLESLLDSKEIKPVNPKRNQPWIFIGRTDAEAPVLWPLDVKSWLIWKGPDAGKDLEQEKKGMTEGGMIGWHHRLNGHESEQTPGDSEGQGSPACRSPWGHKEWDETKWLNKIIPEW